MYLLRTVGEMKDPDYYGFPNGHLDFSYVTPVPLWNALTITI